MTAVVLNDDVLNSLRAHPKAAGIPCLQFIQVKAQRPCNCSRDKMDPKKVIAGEHARICVFQLPPERLAEFKALVKAEQLVIYMTTPGFPRRAVI